MKPSAQHRPARLRLCLSAIVLILPVHVLAQPYDDFSEPLTPAFGRFAAVWGTEPSTSWVDLIDEDANDAFNVFFDQASMDLGLGPTYFEVLKQHVLDPLPGENTAVSGWRFDSGYDGWAFALGDEVRGRYRLAPVLVESARHGWLRETLRDVRWSAYTATGLRAMRLEDRFDFVGFGSILGRTSVSTQVDHRIVGPELGLGVVAEGSIFRFEAAIVGLVGYGDAEAWQSGVFGEEVIPGALNRPSVARATTSINHRNLDSFTAVHGELRLKGSCQLTQKLRADLIWVGVTTGSLYSAGYATAWNAPDFGIHQPERQRIDYHNWFFGLTYTH